MIKIVFSDLIPLKAQKSYVTKNAYVTWDHFLYPDIRSFKNQKNQLKDAPLVSSLSLYFLLILPIYLICIYVFIYRYIVQYVVYIV